jgi:hypothetical protein
MIIHFQNLGYTKNVLSENQMFPIKTEIDKIQNNWETSIPNNTLLAGNINREYGLVDCYNYAEQMLLPYMDDYSSGFSYYKGRQFKLNSLWVNYQRKHEFNPMHTHTGVLSFVMWIKIPFTNEEEAKMAPGRYSNMFSPGNFQFVFTDTIGTVTKHLIPADKTYENTLVVFPSMLNHQVHPFYSSNDYRISVSGNFNLV